LGLIAGIIAKLIYPGRQGGGIFATTLLGILGAVVGGQLTRFLPFTFPFHSLVMAVIGAIILIFLWGLIFRKPA
jgi:uncharacterized membrane protein YeaQ/YmgE (transglycosylase-associated protein family)